jgi:pimeloyl-ACP methyl ester carboxylesterase/predicted amidohydrolase
MRCGRRADRVAAFRRGLSTRRSAILAKLAPGPPLAAPATMEPRVAFCRNRAGRRIGYLTWGDGPVLVVPPGWVSHLELQWHYLGMEAFYGQLAESFRLVFYDRRGCGLSERVRDDFTLDAEVADLEAVIDAVAPGETVSLLGVSQAGPISIAYAAEHPARVTRLVLVGAYHTGAAIAPPEVRTSLVALVRASWGIGADALASIFVPGDDPAFRRNVARFQREATTKEMAAALLDSGYRFDVADRLAAVRTPTLVIHRRRDRAIGSRLAAELAAGIAGARLVQLEGDIHFPWLGDWQPIAGLIEEFVAGTPRRAHTAEPPAKPADAAQPCRLVHYRVDSEAERSACRIAIAQIGEPADLPVPGPSGVYRLPESRVDAVADKLQRFVDRAAEARADLIVFPEMSVDLNHARLATIAEELARDHKLIVVLGGYHDETARTNVCTVLGPEGLLWRQRKHIPALLRSGPVWIEEPIETTASPIYIVATTRIARIAIAICRDFLDLELRLALKNSEPAVDLVINPAFSPVTADFRAAHLEARRALYACTVFCNFAAFGGSCFESPDKAAPAVELPAGEERLEVAEVPVFAIRAERAAWDARAHRRFIQSTRR